MAGTGSNLLGRNWLTIKWDWNQMFYIGRRKGKPWQQMIDKYTDVFWDELGTVKGVEAHPHIRESAIPKYFKSRPLAYALQGPIVLIVKGDGSIRICRDF